MCYTLWYLHGCGCTTPLQHFTYPWEDVVVDCGRKRLSKANLEPPLDSILPQCKENTYFILHLAGKCDVHTHALETAVAISESHKKAAQKRIEYDCSMACQRIYLQYFVPQKEEIVEAELEGILDVLAFDEMNEANVLGVESIKGGWAMPMNTERAVIDLALWCPVAYNALGDLDRVVTKRQWIEDYGNLTGWHDGGMMTKLGYGVRGEERHAYDVWANPLRLIFSHR